jgi:hypothetical protein
LRAKTKKGGERQMSYLSDVTSQRPTFRVTAGVFLAFCCAAPLVLAFSTAVAYGVHLLIH